MKLNFNETETSNSRISYLFLRNHRLLQQQSEKRIIKICDRVKLKSILKKKMLNTPYRDFEYKQQGKRFNRIHYHNKTNFYNESVIEFISKILSK